MGRKAEDLTGIRFGKLTVVERDCGDIGTGAYWICRCDCGNYSVASTSNLKKGASKSCGCSKKENKSNLSHGMSNSKLYKVWVAMKRRCENKADSGYHNYGGRGIAVCEEWKNDFVSFCKWAMDNGYKEGLTIDRINNDGNYSPENCRWATRKEQASNLRKTIFLEYCGERYSLSQWGDITGYGSHAIYDRVFIRGWAVEDALSIPVNTYKNYKKKY